MWNRRQFLASTAAAVALPRAFAQPKQPLFIDSHVHVWKHDPAFPFASGVTPPATDATAEMLLELMPSNNVARTVLIQVVQYRWDNRYIADVLRRHPRQ